jgi:hypothetical protein
VREPLTETMWFPLQYSSTTFFAFETGLTISRVMCSGAEKRDFDAA